MSRKQTMKVYHGIPKSITDEHTIFYASLNGTCYSKDNEYMDLGTGIFTSMPTGYGYRFNGDSNVVIPTDKVNVKEGTIDLFVNFDDYVKSTAGNCFVSFENTNGNRVLELRINDSGSLIYFRLFDDSDFDRQIDMVSVENQNKGIHNIRVTWALGSIKIYLDGSLSSFSNNKYMTPISKVKNIVIGNGKYTSNTIYAYPHKGTLADIHISDIDRGDYFPNLPQDFIDGKAIIKPRFGQQQIKGDPLYNQYTILKVPNANNISSSESYKKDGYDYYVNIPELKTTGSYSWSATHGTIMIKGLNGESISGIVDDDMVLCRILRYEVEGDDTTNTAKVYVDSVDKLAINDKVKTMHMLTLAYGTEELTIVDIDNKNNLITLSGANSDFCTGALPGWSILVKYTTPKSYPIVKTEDGVAVNGTWGWIKGSEVKFTLGENENIAGKDLYVEYLLNIPGDNSDFDKLPSDIVKAYNEDGLEMFPVDKIIIDDDFKYKVSNSTKECPHIARASHSTSLLNPSSFTTEFSNQFYSQISNSDSTTKSTSAGESGIRPQQLFSFNLIEMVERKLGCEIPSYDKVAYLCNILDSEAKVIVHGYGSTPNGPKLTLRLWDVNNNIYIGNDSVYTNNTNSINAITLKTYTLTTNRITNNGFVHAILFTDASDGTTASTIYTDYVSIEIKLKLDSTYTTLYCKNTRAREDKCNPVLIQKETKTVKRYLPSKECFTTECRYVDQKGISISTSKIYTVLFELPSVYITTQGTGSYNSIANDFAKNCLSFLGISSTYKYCNEDISDFDVSGYSYKTTRFNQVLTQYYYNGVKYIPSKLPDGVLNVATLYPCIVNYNGEIYLHLSIITYVNKVRDTISYYLYPITNRPLLK